MINDQLAKKYEAEKARLNPEQLKAVETIEGPVMVLAGPGTGKTQILTLRIAEILKKTQIGPKNILALTFTESAASEMRHRLLDLIGPTGSSVVINTFHGLANSIITESGINFYNTHQLIQIDNLAQFELIGRLTTELEDLLLRPPGQPDKYTKDIAKMISNLKREEIEPDRLRELITEEVNRIETDADCQKKSGEMLQKWKSRLEQLARTRAFATIYEQYQAALSEAGWYDYDDMILFVIRAFKANPDLKQQYQEQYQYILVDEYQDTNSSQNELVRLLADFDDAPNLFVVGDDKQSIYRFQGASVANLAQFINWYPTAEIINLKHNYRSYQELLDASDELIKNNQHQLANHAKLSGFTSALVATKTDPGSVAIQVYSTTDAETLGVAEQIQTLLRQGVEANQIAILYRQNNEASRFVDVFSRLGIPCLKEQSDQILNDYDIRRLRILIEAAENPSQNNQTVFLLLHMNFSQISANDLLSLTKLAREQHKTYFEIISTVDLAELNLENPDAIHSCGERLADWYKQQYNLNLSQSVEYILNDSGLLANIMESPDKLERLERVRAFFNSVRLISVLNNQPTLRTLIDKLALREKYNISISGPNGDAGQASAVRLMTAHKAKGQEFDVVFIVNAHDKVWGAKSKRESIALPPGIVAEDTEPNDDEEEERRLFFVAMTRAKKQLIITHPEESDNATKVNPSRFVVELGDKATSTPYEPRKITVETFFVPPKVEIQANVAASLLDESIVQYALSPTSLNTYLQCPQLFLYQNIYRIPGVRNSSQAYGDAIHKALEYIGRQLKDGRPAPSWPDVFDIFEKRLKIEGLTDFESRTYLDRAEKVLKTYLETEVPNWPKPIDIEYDFRRHSVLLDGIIPITGKLDKIEPIAGTNKVRIIDYKTGSAKSRNDILGQTKSGDQDYWRQLQFYYVLAAADPHFPYEIGEVALTFIDNSAKFKTEVFVVDQADVDSMRELIRQVRSRILEHDFIHTPHKSRGFDDESVNLCDRLNTITQLAPIKITAK